MFHDSNKVELFLILQQKVSTGISLNYTLQVGPTIYSPLTDFLAILLF